MRENLDKMLAGLREYFSKMSRASRIRMGILLLAIIIIAVVAVAFLTRTKWVPLDNVDLNRIAQVEATLGGYGVPVRRESYDIYVPENRLEDAQRTLYEENLVGTARFDDSNIDGASGFGTTTDHAKKLYDLDLAERISTQIKQIPGIANALVIVHSGETSPFRIQTNTKQATASVQVTLGDRTELTHAEAQTIYDMVKNSVPGIEYENITVADSFGRTYKQGEEDTSLIIPEKDMFLEYEKRMGLQMRLTEQFKTQVEHMLVPAYGENNVKVMPFIKLNFDEVSVYKEEFDPPVPGNEEGMLRSQEQLYERQREWADAMGIPGTDENGMGVAEYPYVDGDDADYYYRAVINSNYEINMTKTQLEVANGYIEEASIAILINSDYLGPDVDIEPPQFQDEIRDLAAKAMGIDTRNVSVQYIPFGVVDTTLEDMRAAQEAREARETREKWIDRIFMYGTIILLAVMLIMLIRSIVKTLRPPIPEPEMILAAEGAEAGLELIIPEDGEALKEIEEIEIGKKSAGLEQIERFIDKDPAAVAQLLRNWLTDDF